MGKINLSVVTPEKAIVSGIDTEAVVLPGELGQMTILPGHTSLLTNLGLGSFAYKQEGIWKWAYLTGGFAQVGEDKMTVLAETVELAHEIDVAEAELELKNISEKLKNIKVDNTDYPALQAQKDLLSAKLAAASQQSN